MMSTRGRVLLVMLAMAMVTNAAPGAPAQDRHDIAAQQDSFKLAPGFQANLFASEKDGVVNPIAIRWDERGRLWVVGSKNYPQLKPGAKPIDQVIILEDTDGDNVADKTTVFADGLLIPTGLELAPGTGPGAAAYVAEGTKIWLISDLDGDGREDQREVVLRGFGIGDNHQLINSFRWSPGGELMFSQGLHAFSRVETPWGISTLHQAGLWRFRPRQHRLDGFYGGSADPQNPWGWVFTRWGQPIVVAGNSGTMYHPTPEMIRGWQGGRRDPIWKQGRGRKTTGPEIIESGHFPDEWQGLLLPAGYINNSVWTLVVEPHGAGLKVVEHPTLPPLIQSTHGSFRPIDVKLGPDGALYVADWYNPIIGHYQVSLRHPDRDTSHGRIWRITAQNRPLLSPPQIANASLPELFELMRSRDRWPREQAKRMLFGIDSASVIPALRRWCRQLDSRAPDMDYALMQALGVLEAHETPDPTILVRVLSARTPEARAYAASTVARWADRLPGEFDAAQALLALAADPDPRVRLAAIVAAGNIPRAESMAVVLSAAERDRDAFIDTALHAAVAVLKPSWEPYIRQDISRWKPAWHELIKELDRRRPLPPAARTVAEKRGTPIVPVYGRLRATPYITGTIAADVLTRGDATRGAAVFRAIGCDACHRVGDEGGVIGPRLDSIGSAQPLEQIIGMVLEPQSSLTEGYETLKLTSRAGDVVVGTVVASNASEITLRDPAGNEHVIPVAEIKSREMVGSLMPAGLTDSLNPEELRDLFAYLTELGKVK